MKKNKNIIDEYSKLIIDKMIKDGSCKFSYDEKSCTYKWEFTEKTNTQKEK